MKLKGKNAISLIVLVITILVLSILAATVIISLSNTNIISEANDAVKKTETQQIEEAKTLMYVDGILGDNPEPQTIGDTILTWVESDQKVTAVGTKNVEKEGVTIPAGFGYVEGTKDEGLVIEDKDGNQFVWVPVDYTIAEGETPTAYEYTYTNDAGTTETKTAYLYESFTNVFKSESEDTSYTEPYDSGYTNESAEYYAMMESVQKYGGFYIARFEAGDSSATSARTNLSKVGKLVSKKGVYVYNYVLWGTSMTEIGEEGAVYLSRKMATDYGYTSVVSTLCYGVQWDATMNFVADSTHSITNSTTWGNYRNNTKTGAGSLQTTGYSETWKAKNIYDLAGNVWEWTMEVYSSNYRVVRGGYYDSSGSSDPAADRAYDFPNYGHRYMGFRPALYIVVEYT